MSNVMKKQIKELLEDPQRAMNSGLWFSGYEGEGKFKRWYNDQLGSQYFYKNGKKYGEFKEWWYTGQPRKHGFYKNGELVSEYKQWDINGQLTKHTNSS